MWSISTILMGLYSFMMDNKPTTGSIDTSDAMKRKLAAESLEYNVKNEKLFCALFPEYVELWNTREEERKARLLANGGGGGTLANSSSKEEEMAVVPTNTMGGIMMDNVLAFGAGFVAILSIFFAILRFCN